jgi:hypothetical protein
VRATDAAGNTDGTPASHSWSIGSASTLPPAGRVRPWTAQFIGASGTPTQTEAVADAKNFDLIIAHASAYKKYVSQMKQANTNLRLVVYMNTTFTYRTDLVESAYSHDANGKRISPKSWPSTYLLNPLSSAAISFKKGEASSLLTQSGYDGIYLDATGSAALKLSYVTALPINPTTRKEWTVSDWLTAVRVNLVDNIKTVVLPRPMYLNSLKDGHSYFDPVEQRSATLTPGIVASVAETWLHETVAPITAYPSEAVWKQNVDMLIDAEARGYGVLQMTRVWADGTTAQKDAWYNYTLASWLLGNQGRSYFNFSYQQGDSTTPRPWNRLDLGAASGSYIKSSGVYQRQFANGKVLVNPTSSTFTVSLGGAYRTLSGQSVNSVTLGPNSARILTK